MLECYQYQRWSSFKYATLNSWSRSTACSPRFRLQWQMLVPCPLGWIVMALQNTCIILLLSFFSLICFFFHLCSLKNKLHVVYWVQDKYFIWKFEMVILILQSWGIKMQTVGSWDNMKGVSPNLWSKKKDQHCEWSNYLIAKRLYINIYELLESTYR